jgi:pyruvate carboxylase
MMDKTWELTLEEINQIPMGNRRLIAETAQKKLVGWMKEIGYRHVTQTAWRDTYPLVRIRECFLIPIEDWDCLNRDE